MNKIIALLSVIIAIFSLSSVSVSASESKGMTQLKSDYCGIQNSRRDLVPDRPFGSLDFSNACLNHDICYQKSNGNLGPIQACDEQFRLDLKNYCQNLLQTSKSSRWNPWFNGRKFLCNLTASVYSGAVKQNTRRQVKKTFSRQNPSIY